jgi:hypothetical protein
MEPLDLKALRSKASRYPNLDELRALPVLYVLELAGVEIEQRADGGWTCRSPFRPDNKPSFDIFGEKLERWGDLAEGKSGDVLDLIGRFIHKHTGEHPAFVEIKDEAARLLSKFQTANWAGPTECVRKPFDLDKAKSFVDAVRSGDYGGREEIESWLDSRRDILRSMSAEYLMEHFRLGWDTQRIVIPYYDRADALCAYKTRKPGEPVVAAPSTNYDNLLYGLWRDTDPERIVVLCEGESDVWSGTYAAPEGYIFLGLPTGAGSRPVQAHLLSGRRVIVAFDGDPAGRGATLLWAEALLEVKAEVRICILPEKCDLAQLGESVVDLLATRIRAYEQPWGVLP